MSGKRRKYPTEEKAKKILREGRVRGHALTEAQKGFFGLIAGGETPSRKRMRKHNPAAPYGRNGCFSARGKMGIG